MSTVSSHQACQARRTVIAPTKGRSIKPLSCVCNDISNSSDTHCQSNLTSIDSWAACVYLIWRSRLVHKVGSACLHRLRVQGLLAHHEDCSWYITDDHIWSKSMFMHERQSFGTQILLDFVPLKVQKFEQSSYPEAFTDYVSTVRDSCGCSKLHSISSMMLVCLSQPAYKSIALITLCQYKSPYINLQLPTMGRWGMNPLTLLCSPGSFQSICMGRLIVLPEWLYDMACHATRMHSTPVPGCRRRVAQNSRMSRCRQMSHAMLEHGSVTYFEWYCWLSCSIRVSSSLPQPHWVLRPKRTVSSHSSCHSENSNLEVKVFQYESCCFLLPMSTWSAWNNHIAFSLLGHHLTCCLDWSCSQVLNDLRCFILHRGIDHDILKCYDINQTQSADVSTEITRGCMYICCDVTLHIYALAICLIRSCACDLRASTASWQAKTQPLGRGMIACSPDSIKHHVKGQTNVFYQSSLTQTWWGKYMAFNFLCAITSYTPWNF